MPLFVLTIFIVRKFVSDIMHLHAPEAFSQHDPYGKCIHQVPKHPIGIHKWWLGDSHDKLYHIGFQIWAMVDDATSKWLDAWIVLSNHMGEVIRYLFLCLVEKYGGKCHSIIQLCITNVLLQGFCCSQALTVAWRLPSCMDSWMHYSMWMLLNWLCMVDLHSGQYSTLNLTSMSLLPMSTYVVFITSPLNIHGFAYGLIEVIMSMSSSWEVLKKEYTTPVYPSNSEFAHLTLLSYLYGANVVSSASGYGWNFYGQTWQTSWLSVTVSTCASKRKSQALLVCHVMKHLPCQRSGVAITACCLLMWKLSIKSRRRWVEILCWNLSLMSTHNEHKLLMIHWVLLSSL